MNRGWIDGFAAGLQPFVARVRFAVPTSSSRPGSPCGRPGQFGHGGWVAILMECGFDHRSAAIVSGFCSASISKGVFHWQGTISPETGEMGTQRGEATPSDTHMDHATRMARGPAIRGPGPLSPLASLDIGHEGANLALAGRPEKGSRVLRAAPSAGAIGGAGKGVSTFDAELSGTTHSNRAHVRKRRFRPSPGFAWARTSARSMRRKRSRFQMISLTLRGEFLAGVNARVATSAAGTRLASSLWDLSAKVRASEEFVSSMARA